MVRALVVALVIVALPGVGAAQRAEAVKHFEQGEAFMKTEQYDLAAKEYAKAYEALPKAGFLFNIALAYESAGARGDAIDHYRRYLKESPDGAAAQEARARLAKLEREAEREASRARAEEARRAEEAERRSKADTHVAAAQTRSAKGDYAGAIKEYRAAYEIAKDPERLFDIAMTYREAGNAAEAVIHFESYLAEAPTGARHLQARRLVRTLSKQLAPEARSPDSGDPSAAVTTTADPGPTLATWSFGAKVGMARSDPGFGDESFGESCREEVLLSVGAAAFVSYRLAPRIAVQIDAALEEWTTDLNCETASGAADATFLAIPATVRVAAVRNLAFDLHVYAGLGPFISVTTSDTVSIVDGDPLLLVVGLESGLGLGPGRLLLDIRYDRSGTLLRMEHEGAGGLVTEGNDTFSVLVGYRFGR